MAIIAFRMTLHSIFSASTTRRDIAFSFRSPSRSSGDPAYLCFAHRASHPITAPFLHQDYFTRRTQHSFSLFHHFVKHFFCLLPFFPIRSHIDITNLLLIFFAILSFVYSLRNIHSNHFKLLIVFK